MVVNARHRIARGARLDVTGQTRSSPVGAEQFAVRRHANAPASGMAGVSGFSGAAAASGVSGFSAAAAAGAGTRGGDGVGGLDEDVEDVFAELKDELYDQISDMEDDLDDIRDDLSPEEEEWCERFVEIGYALAEDFSLENISDVFDHVEALAEVAEDSEVFGTDDLDDLFDIFDGIDTAILTAINTALFISMAWALIWGLIGGGLRIRGFVIAGLVFSLFYTGICCGALVTLLVLAIHIALIVIITMINREYRAYKASIRPVAYGIEKICSFLKKRTKKLVPF